MAPLDLLMARSAPPEIGLLAGALISRLPSPGIRMHDQQGGDDLEIRSGAGTATVRSSAGHFLLRRENDEDVIPWFLPLIPMSPARPSNRLRVGLAGGPDERRLRMSWKTIAELRSRGFGFESVVLGSCELPPGEAEKPDEVHQDLSPAEYLASLERIEVILECTDSYDTASFLAIAGRDAGIPVVAHQDRPDLSRAGNSHAQVWSADGFAESIQMVGRERTEPVDPASELERFVELIGAS